jgi:hypothetical protein
LPTTETEKDTIHTLISLTADLGSRDQGVQSSAYAKILDLAEQGIADAMFQVSRCLRHGWGVTLDEDHGDYWLRRACATIPSSSHALFVLGMQHFLQQRPDSNPHQGFYMVEQAAAAGLPLAVVSLSRMHEEGSHFFGPDLRKAYRVLASSFGVNTDHSIRAAYDAFVARHSPTSELLDS